jgi:hypothetical protein
MNRRLERVKAYVCPTCPIRKICPQFDEQLAACADAEDIQREELPMVHDREFLGRFRRPGRTEE